MHRRLTQRAGSPSAPNSAWAEWIPVIFLVFVFSLGGSGRSDVASLPLLRGGSVLFAFWAAVRLDSADWRRVRVPLALWSAVAIWMVIQIVPLPPEMWQSLPGRDVVVQADRLVGQPDLWRPLSLSPSQTMNSLLAMTVPLAATLIVAQVPADGYRRLTLSLIVIACFSTFIGLAQLLSGPGSAAYLYRITNITNMVGLFANSNHHALFLASAIVLVGMALRDELMRRRQNKLLLGLLALAGVYLTAMTAFTGSRVGFAAGILAFAVGYVMVVVVQRSQSGESVPAGRGVTKWRSDWFLVYAPPALVMAALGTALLLTNRTTSLSRALGEDIAADMRVRALPTVQSMIESFWVLGSGFGSFPDVFKIYEPDSLLQASYFNHAHNDWAELLITGGLPFAAVVVATLIWVALGFRSLGLRNLVRGFRGDCRLPVLVILTIMASASFVEYPLRVPSIQTLMVVLLVMLYGAASSRRV